jgi:DNA gyrase/topoisomerase IV subunit B
MDARIEFIYKPALDFTIVMERPNGELNEIVPSEELYREVGYLMNYLGEQFEIVADQLNIPLLILERLVYAVKSLYPVIRYDELPEYFKSLEGDDLVMVTCNPENQSLVVSIGRQDYTIGLQDVGELIKNQLLANVKHFQYNHCFFKVRGKLKSTEITEPTLVSPMQFYTLLKGLNNITKVMRYKGLGRMPTQSCFATLMDPTTRSLTHITGIGSESMDYDLVGNDSTARKQLMASNGYLSSAFQRANELLQAEWDEIQ